MKHYIYPIVGLVLAGCLIGSAIWAIQPNTQASGTATNPLKYHSSIAQTQSMQKEAVQSLQTLCSESSVLNKPIDVKSSYLEERNYSIIRSHFTKKYSLSITLQDTIIFNNDCDIDANKVESILQNVETKYGFKNAHTFMTSPEHNNAFVSGGLSEGPQNANGGSRGIGFSGYDIMNGINKIYVVSDYKNNNVPLSKIPVKGAIK